MLPKSYRLPSPEIRPLMRSGKRLSTAGLQLVFMPNAVGVCRFAFVVPTGVDKRATVRNRIKRLLRQDVYVMLPKMQRNFDAVVIVRSKHSSSVEELLHRADIL